MLLDVKKHFSRFLGMVPNRLHFAAHSHHYWPDASFDAQQLCWMDAARLADEKWGMIFSEVIPAVRQGIAKRLSLPDAGSIVFAGNTHELVTRLLSCFDARRKIRILTTDSEFYSFRRQVDRLAEEGLVEVTAIAAEPFATFAQRFAEAAAGDYDLVFFSHVFFNSGYVVPDLAAIVASVARAETLVCIDGYHGFMAVPTDLRAVADRVFYLSGGYKYAMAGEGVCFMHCPPAYAPRPRNTGWFAEMDSLSASKTGRVDYESGGARFYGSTLAPDGLYRLRGVFEWLDHEGIDVAAIHHHVMGLQEDFLRHLPETLSGDMLLVKDGVRRGHFLTFQTPQAASLQERMKEQGIVTDNRGDRLRFGFGIYHDRRDVEALAQRMKDL